MRRQASSISSTDTGFLPMTRRALSPRPIPTTILPCEISFSVAMALAVTVTSRVAGLVTHGPIRMRSVPVAISAKIG